jgi:hypothetical protein
MSQTINKIMEKFSDSDKKIKEFADIIDAIDTNDNKKKLLWKEIYENALIDRQNAYMLFTDVYVQMQGDKADHVTLGSILSKYLERMNKSNDQMLKLAELIAKEEEAAASIDPNDIFRQIKE